MHTSRPLGAKCAEKLCIHDLNAQRVRSVVVVCSLLVPDYRSAILPSYCSRHHEKHVQFKNVIRDRVLEVVFDETTDRQPETLPCNRQLLFSAHMQIAGCGGKDRE